MEIIPARPSCQEEKKEIAKILATAAGVRRFSSKERKALLMSEGRERGIHVVLDPPQHIGVFSCCPGERSIMDPLTPREDRRLAAILFRVSMFAARLLAHEFHFQMSFDLPKDQHLLRVKRTTSPAQLNPDCTTTG